MLEREHRDVDEDGQDDDRPAVVADEPVDPLQRAQQRHCEEREDSVVDGADEIAVHALQHVEVLRSDKHALIHRRLRVQHFEPHHVALNLGLPGHRRRARPIDHAHRARFDEAGEEVVIVDAGKRKVALPRGLAEHALGSQPFDRSVCVEDGLRLLHVGAEGAALGLDVHAVAQARPPLDRRIQRRAAVADLHRKRHDVGLGIQSEHFLRAQPVAAVELEGEGRRRRRRVDRGRRRRAIQRAVQSRALGLVGDAQRKGSRRRGRQPRRHQVDGLARLIEVSQQLPALDDRRRGC